MMKIKRCFALLLCTVITLSFNFTAIPAFADNNPFDYELYNLNIFSNVCDITSSEIYEHDGKFYMNIEDIAALARFSLTTETENKQLFANEESTEAFALAQGVRTVYIQKETGWLRDDVYYICFSGSMSHFLTSEIMEGDSWRPKTVLSFLTIDSKYYYECVPLLTYLGAECKVSEFGGLIVTMPAYTIWEAIAPNMEKYWKDTNIKNQSAEEKEWNIRFDMANDMLGDIWSIPEKWGDDYNTGEYLEQALYEVFDVNIMGFDSVQKLIGEENKATNDNIEGLLNAADLTRDGAHSLADLSDKLLSDILEECDFIAEDSSKALDDALGDVADVEFAFILATIDSYNTIEHRMNYDEHTKNCFTDVLNDDVMEYLNEFWVNAKGLTRADFEQYKTEYEQYKAELEKDKSEFIDKYGFQPYFLMNSGLFDDIEFADVGFSPHWKNEALEISEILKDSEKIAEDVLWDKYTTAANETILEFGAEQALTKLVGGVPASFGMLSYSLMTDVALKDSFEASKSSIYSYCLSDMQYDILEPLTFVSMDVVFDDECKDVKKMEIMKDMIALYYRITIAFCQNNAKAIEEYGFGKTKREQAVAHYNQVAETLAVYLYMITNCTVSEIPDYNELSDSVITEEWMEQFRDTDTDAIINEVLENEQLYEDAFEMWFQDLDLDGVCEFIVDFGSCTEGYYLGNEKLVKITQQGDIHENIPSMDYLRLYYDSETESYGFHQEAGVTMWYTVNDVTYKDGTLTCQNIASRNVDDGSGEIQSSWYAGGKDISEAEYADVYNAYIQKLTEYSYTTDRIRWRDFNGLSEEEKYERLKKSYDAFAVGKKIGAFDEYLGESVGETTLPNSSVSDAKAHGTFANNLKWELSVDGILTITGQGDIPEYGREDAPWKSYSDIIYEIQIGNGITRIGGYAFAELKNLKKVVMATSVSSIGSGAFDKCESLYDVKFSENITRVGSEAFSDTAWYDNQPSGKMIYIGKVAYFYKSKRFINVTKISGESGSYISGYYDSVSNITIRNGTVSIADNAFEECPGLLSVNIPDTVTHIGTAAFSWCVELNSIVIPSSVTELGSGAFTCCTNLEEVSLSPGITKIAGAFYGCRNIKTLTIPNTVTTIEASSFTFCDSLENLYIPSSVTTIEDYAFYKCNSDMIIHCATGSYTETYANQKGYTYIADYQ